MKTAFPMFFFACVLAVVCGAEANVSSRRTPIVIAVEKALPSVVNIGTEKLVKVQYTDPLSRFRGNLFDEFFSDFFSQSRGPGYQVKHSLGSGVIIDPRGFILTNYHVIERASKIRVTLADESDYEAAFLAGDEVNDLALIRIKPDKPLTAIEFAEGDDLMLGETVIVLGNPFGLAQTVSVGVLSAKDREARYQGQVLYRDILQTDAAVNPGSSGGPLLNIDGQLIGISVAIHREAENIGFAVPVTRARELAGQWLSPLLIGRATPGFAVARQDGRIVVIGEDAGSGAAVHPGDVILSVDGLAVRDLFDYHKSLLDYKPGDVIPLQIEKEGGERGTVEVVMIQVLKPSGILLARERLGLEFAEPGDAPPVLPPTASGKGLAITNVLPDSAAAKVGLRSGLIVMRINGAETASMDDIGMALNAVKAGDRVGIGLVSLRENGNFLIAQRSDVELVAE